MLAGQWPRQQDRSDGGYDGDVPSDENLWAWALLGGVAIAVAVAFRWACQDLRQTFGRAKFILSGGLSRLPEAERRRFLQQEAIAAVALLVIYLVVRWLVPRLFD